MSAQSGTEKKKVIEKAVGLVLRPIQKFIHLEAGSGISLIFATACALFLANSTFASHYFDFINTSFIFQTAGINIDKTLLLFVNDGLMAIFFFLVGLEIKREILVGELSSARKASFAIFGAIGGMVVPALIYVAFNKGQPGISGWGIPMATDIAFALGVLTLIGKGVPATLKIFLLALAIVDDLGAISIIAVFYTDSIASQYLFGAMISLAILFMLNSAGFRNIGIGIMLGVITWYCFLKSGVHATIAGVLLAFLTPSYSAQKALLTDADSKTEKHEFLLDHLIHALHPWVAFLIMPIFAFFNAGVSFAGADIGALLSSPITLGIAVGLVAGKAIGILGTTVIACKLGWADRPAGTSWTQILGISLLAGIGFTMSLFIGSLAFDNEAAITAAKIGIFLGSGIAMVLGSGILIASRSKTSEA